MRFSFSHDSVLRAISLYLFNINVFALLCFLWELYTDKFHRVRKTAIQDQIDQINKNTLWKIDAGFQKTAANMFVKMAKILEM